MPEWSLKMTYFLIFKFCVNFKAEANSSTYFQPIYHDAEGSTKLFHEVINLSDFINISNRETDSWIMSWWAQIIYSEFVSLLAILTCSPDYTQFILSAASYRWTPYFVELNLFPSIQKTTSFPNAKSSWSKTSLNPGSDSLISKPKKVLVELIIILTCRHILHVFHIFEITFCNYWKNVFCVIGNFSFNFLQLYS